MNFAEKICLKQTDALLHTLCIKARNIQESNVETKGTDSKGRKTRDVGTATQGRDFIIMFSVIARNAPFVGDNFFRVSILFITGQ